MTVTVVGEAIVDLVPGESAGAFVAYPGGSPYNVAVGLARLGCPTALLARLSDTAFGRILHAHAAAEGVDLTCAPLSAEPTTLAVVSVDEQGRADYDFYVTGTSDWHWSQAELVLPPGTQVLHLGSLASWTPPGDALIHDLAARARAEEVLVSYDPNLRPRLQGDRAIAIGAVERSVAVAHVVKASADDLAWLHPGQAPAHIAGRWLDLGAELVVVTDGPEGAIAYRSAHSPLPCAARETTVVDTVGAGDAFTAGLLDALVRRDLHRPGRLGADLAPVLEDAVLVSSLTCERPGADPPRRTTERSADGLMERDL